MINRAPPLIAALLISILASMLSLHSVTATSPSFVRQEIADPLNDWDLITEPQLYSWKTQDSNTTKVTVAKNISDCIPEGTALPPDMAAISYTSNGDIPSTTIWLTSPLEELPLQKFGYTLSMDVRSVYDAGTDYYVTISKDPFINKWNLTINEGSSTIDEKKLIYHTDYTNSIQYGQKYITIPINLSYMNFPDQYKIIVTSWDQFLSKELFCYLIDASCTWIHIPPPQYTISTEPSSIALRQGEQTKVELKIKSGANLKSSIFLSSKTTAGIQLDARPNKIYLPPNDSAISILEIKALNDADARVYTIPLEINISYPTSGRILGSTESVSNPVSKNITENSNLVIQVLPALTLGDYLRKSAEEFASPIGQIYATLVAIIGGITTVSTLIIKRISKKPSQKK